MFENRVLRGIFVSEGDGGAEENYIMRNFIICVTPNIVRMFKSRRKRWERYVGCIGEMLDAHRIMVGKPKERI
jgi:hypothetical protein